MTQRVVRARGVDHLRWCFIPDPERPSTLTSAQRQANKRRRERSAQKRAAAEAAKLELSAEDQLRLKLREKKRRITPAGATATLPTLPGVQGLSAALRYLEGGRALFIDAVQLAMLERDPIAEQWWSVYADLTPYERSIVSLDDVCAASGTRPSKLMAAVVSIAMEHSRDVGNLIAALLHPEVVSKMGESAKRIDGDFAEIAMKDRHAFLQGRNFLPVPRGAQLNVHLSASAQAAAAATNEPSVPSFTQTLQVAGAARALPAGGSTASDLSFLRKPDEQVEEAVLISPDPTDDESES